MLKVGVADKRDWMVEKAVFDQIKMVGSILTRII
jgi:hypothetical protein